MSLLCDARHKKVNCRTLNPLPYFVNQKVPSWWCSERVDRGGGGGGDTGIRGAGDGGKGGGGRG